MRAVPQACGSTCRRRNPTPLLRYRRPPCYPVVAASASARDGQLHQGALLFRPDRYSRGPLQPFLLRLVIEEESRPGPGWRWVGILRRGEFDPAGHQGTQRIEPEFQSPEQPATDARATHLPEL